MPRRTQDQWSELIERQLASGETQVAFCQREGLCPNYFSLRRSRYLRSRPTTGRAVTPAAPFVQVLREDRAPSSGATVLVPCGDSALRIESASAHYVAELVRALS